MNAPLQNLAISLGVMQIARKIPFDDPQVLQYVRIGYVASQVILLAVYYFTSLKIKRKNDQTILKYGATPSPSSQDPGQLVTTTVRDYDLTETSKLVRAAYTSIAMMAFLHLYLKYTQPLFVQAIMGIKGLYEAKTVKIHILGQAAEGDLKRPFKGPAGMFGASASPQTDKAAIDEAEKRIGSKKEE
ncbi:inorganic phosphate transporter [Heterobasidion irregulare TC 32-1]|uniref:Inorganic phosphate transporter n=1 Tax=Heterobasidion irregulare (strain TC 32-1) TaxID=747525 RepID=W4K9V0_HETIT|nr:inorganic phosphate transporter [Heterobasidion irregulare TC 32-1]ETW82529.1 inorganic phosphate transporter [Heterobasidion irregulare TC 32-1]